MNPEKVNQLYNFLADNGVEDIGTDMSFMARMQNPKDRKTLYDFLDDNKVEGIGTTFTEFEQILGVDEAPSAKIPSFEDFKEATVAQSRQSVEGRLAEARESLSRTTATDFATEKLFKPHTDIVQEERDYVLRPSEKVMENIGTKKLKNIGKEEYKYLKGQRDISIHNMDNLIAEAKKIQRQMFEKGGGSVKGVNSITGAQITLPSKEAVKIGNLITILEDTRDKYDKMVTKADKEHGKKGGFVAGLGEIDLLNVLTAGWADVFKNIDAAVAIHKASYGGKLTPEEQLYLKMFEEQARLDGIIEAEGGTTRGYNIGSGLAESLPFITSMLTTGGVASAVKGGVTKGLGAIGREAAKEGAEKSLKNIASRAVNGVVGSAAATAATIPLQAGVYNNYIDNAFNEYTTYGRLTDSPIQRMWKSYADAFTDVFTENLGGIISGAAKYMLNGVGAKTAFGRLFGTVGRRIQPFYQDILKRTAFNGFVGEFEEEMLANFLSPLMRGDSKEERNAAWKEAFGKESIVTTLATTALMSAGFGAGKVVSAADATRKYEKFKTKARNALANIEDRRLEQKLVDIMALPTLQERCQAFANMNWQGDYKSMGHGVDYFYNSILKEVYDGVVKMEDANEVVMPTLRTLDTVVERGTSDVVTAQMDGKPVYIIRGVGDNAESAIVQDMEGNRQQVAMSSLQEVNVTPVSEVVADLINKEYNAISAEMDAQEQAEEDATLRERGLVPPSDRAKADQFEPEEVVMVNGKTATISSIDKASGTARVDIEGEEANQQVKIADMQKITPEQISSEVEAQQINQPVLTQDGEIDIVAMGEEQTANYISEKADASYVEDMLADRRKKLKTAQKGIRLPLNLTERQKAIEQRDADIARLEQEISMWEGVKNRLTQPQPTSEVAQETADVAEAQEVAQPTDQATQDVAPVESTEQTTQVEEVPSEATTPEAQQEDTPEEEVGAEATPTTSTTTDPHTREQVDALEWKAGVVMNEEARNHKTTKALDDMAKAAGVRVAFVDSIVEGGKDADGLYDPRTKTIYIASDRLKGANFVAGHEMLHHIKTLSPQAYKEYMETVKAEVGAERFDEAVEGLRQTYRIAILGSLKKSGIVTENTPKEERESLVEREMPSDEVLTEEVVADWTGSLIGYSGGFSDFVKRHKGGVVLRVLRNAVEHIGTFFKGRNSWERTMQRRLKALNQFLTDGITEEQQKNGNKSQSVNVEKQNTGGDELAIALAKQGYIERLPNKTKYNVWSFTADKSSRPIRTTPTILEGVFYDNGFRVASDGIVLVKEKFASYPAEYEGTARMRDGSRTDNGVSYPKYQVVIDNLRNNKSKKIDFDDFLGFLNAVIERETIAHKQTEGKSRSLNATLNNTVVAIKLPTGDIWYGSLDKLQKFALAGKQFGADEVYFKDASTMLLAKNNKGEVALVMPVLVDLYPPYRSSTRYYYEPTLETKPQVVQSSPSVNKRSPERITPSADKTIIEDVGEEIKGARKNALKELAEKLNNVTIENLIALPLSKVFKPTNYAKMVQKGTLPKEDALLLEAITMLITQSSKPKLTKRYDSKKNLESWANRQYALISAIKQYCNADENVTPDIKERILAEPDHTRESAMVEQRKKWNPHLAEKYGDTYTPNPIKVMLDVLRALGYPSAEVGKIDIPTIVANGFNNGYEAQTMNGKRIYSINGDVDYNAILNDVVRYCKIQLGHTDITYDMGKDIRVIGSGNPLFKETGKYIVYYFKNSKSTIVSEQLFDSKEEADKFAENYKGARVKPQRERNGYEEYGFCIIDVVSGERLPLDLPKFPTLEDARAYMQDNTAEINDKANAVVADHHTKGKGISDTSLPLNVGLSYKPANGTKSYVVYLDAQGERVPIKEGFATVQEAYKWLEDNRSKIEDEFAKQKKQQAEFVFFEGEKPRVGKDYRQGRDMTAEDFRDTFGFRGVQFGNWTNQKDRQNAINEAYDALMDMSEILGISPKAVSLNGELGIAFGARGGGRYNAHYELDNIVINLTKTRGAGSLAHEWWHALDNYFARQGGVSMGMATEVKGINIRSEVKDAFRDVVNTVSGTAYDKRSKKRGQYWGSIVEETARLFGEWIVYEAEKRGITNSFLSRGVDARKFEVWQMGNYEVHKIISGEDITFEEYVDKYDSLAGMPYPNRAETEAMSAPMRALFDTIEERETEDGNIVLFSLREVNDRFNEQLATLTEENKDRVILSLGMPSNILLAAGVVNKPMKLYGSKLFAKAKKHGYNLKDIEDLPLKVATPIAVFKGSRNESHAILTEIKIGNLNVLATLSIGKGGNDVDFNIVSSVYGKLGENVIKWIEEGKLEYVDKEKALNYLHHSAPIAEALSNSRQVSETNLSALIAEALSQEIISVTNVVQNFENPSIEPKFSIRTPDTFYSNAEFAVRNIKQEKATPEQWLKMIEKNGGLKAGEDKWLGLSDWLKESKAKTLTKEEVLEYINSNKIVVEDVEYGVQDYMSENEIYESDEYRALEESLLEYEDETPYIDKEKFKELRNKDEDFVDGFDVDYWGEQLLVKNPFAAARYLGISNVGKRINETRLEYTTNGLTNKREIALVVPTIEPWNKSDEIHFGDAGEGRAVAWVRFGDAEAPVRDANYIRLQEIYDRLAELEMKVGSSEGITMEEYEERARLREERDNIPESGNERILVIDEIQSKRHQEGREKGYRTSDIDKYLKDNNVEVKETGEFYEFYKNGELDKRFSRGLLHYDINKAKHFYVGSYQKGYIPEAPFEKNWHEVAMKRILRYAAENGYDKVAWTTGDQQAERYNIGDIVERIVSYQEGENMQVWVHRRGNERMHITTDVEGVIKWSNTQLAPVGERLSDVFGKDLAIRILNREGEDATIYAGKGKEYAAKEISGDGLRIGSEGMKGFYDKILPNFMNKYGKKWGVKVGEVTMPDLAENNTMHSVAITPAMRESIMQGQPLFSLRLPEYQERFKALTEEYNALDKNDAKALADFRARKRTLVEEYWNDFTRALGADVDARAIDSTDNPEVLRPYYDMYIERVRDGRIEGEEITFEEFVEDYNKDEDMIAGHIYDSNIIFIDMAKTDKYTTTKAFTRFFIHEYAHTIIEREVSEQELIDIWNENANTEFGKSLEDGYKDETPNELGDEVLAYTVSGIGNADIRPLLNYIEGDKKVSENDVLKVFGNVLPLNAEKAKQILKIIKNGYREKGAGAAQERAQLLEKGESQLSTWGGGRRPNGGYSAGETYIENGRRVTVLDEDFSIVEDIPEFDESPKYSLKDPIKQLRKENGIVAKSFEKENELIAEKFGTEGVGRKIEKGIFNYLADVQRLQDNLYAAGVMRSDDNDFVNKMEGVRNMVDRALPQELEKYVHPLLKVISTITKDFGFDYTAISDYLAAKHSIEREDESKIQTMSTEANAVWNRERVEKIVSDFESKVPENVRELLWKGVKGIEQRTLEILKKVGVYTAADIEAIQSHNWKYYVPLQGWDTKEEELIEVNKIYDLPQSGTSSTNGRWQEHSAKGRRTKPYDPLATLVAKLHKAVYVAETNKAMHALYNLVTDATRALGTEEASFIFKASDAYYRKTQNGYKEIDADEVTPEELESNRKLHAELRKLYNERKQTNDAATIKKIDAQIKAAKSKLTIFVKAGDMAIPKEVNISQQTTRARRVYFYMNGKRMYIQFVNPKYSTAINGQTLWKRNELDKFVAGWTRWLSQTYTTLNPEFSFVTNPIRDFRDATITHLLDAEHGNIVGFAQYMLPFSGARSAIFRAQRGTAQPLSDKELEEYNLMNRDDRKALIRKYGEKRVYDTLFKWYADNGGATGGGHVYSVQTVADDLKGKVEELKKGDISTHANVYKALSDSAEITTRFATFLASLDKGESVRQAVVNGRNVSVNFNRKGAWSDKIGAYYSFFNASAQGIYKYLTLARKYPKRFVAALMSQIALGYATCLLIDYLYDLLLPDDDGDEIQTIEIPLWERLGYTAIPFMRRNGKVHTIRIPKSITFASFSAIGVLLNELQKQRITGEEALLAAASQMMSSWTYGFSEGAPFWRAAVPTVLQPIADIMNNTDAFGREVYRTDRFKQGIPNSELGLRNVIPWMYSMTKALNKATGGNEFKSGVIDINPSVVQYIMEQYAGGFGVLARKAIEFGASLFTDKVEFEMQNLLLLGRLTYTVEPKSWYPDYKKVQDAFGTAVFSNARNQYQAGYITEDELRQIGMRNYIFKNNDKVIKNLIDLRGNYAPSSMEYKVINREINRQRGLVVKIFEEADFNNRNSISEIIKKYDPNRSNNLTNLYKEYAK